MKKYVEPKMESISFLISDVIAASKPVYGTETGNEFDNNTQITATRKHSLMI